jgi:hypothetical protein
MIALEKILWGYLVPALMAAGGLLMSQAINGYVPSALVLPIVIAALLGTSGARRGNRTLARTSYRA